MQYRVPTDVVTVVSMYTLGLTCSCLPVQKWSLPSSEACLQLGWLLHMIFNTDVSSVLANIVMQSSCCFQKLTETQRMHMFYNAVYPKCCAEDITYTLPTPTHCQELLKFVGSHGSLGIAILDKGDVWHFVSNTHEEGHDHHTPNCYVYLQSVVLGFLSAMPMDMLGVESLCDLNSSKDMDVGFSRMMTILSDWAS